MAAKTASSTPAAPARKPTPAERAVKRDAKAKAKAAERAHTGVVVHAQRFEQLPADEFATRVQPFPNNPRAGAADDIREAIEAIGFYGAVLVQESTGFMLVGNHRSHELLAKNPAHVPVLWIDVDDETALRIVVGDNKIGALGGWKNDLLRAALDTLAPTGLDGLGFKVHEIEPLMMAEFTPLGGVGAPGGGTLAGGGVQPLEAFQRMEKQIRSVTFNDRQHVTVQTAIRAARAVQDPTFTEAAALAWIVERWMLSAEVPEGVVAAAAQGAAA